MSDIEFKTKSSNDLAARYYGSYLASTVLFVGSFFGSSSQLLGSSKTDTSSQLERFDTAKIKYFTNERYQSHNIFSKPTQDHLLSERIDLDYQIKKTALVQAVRSFKNLEHGWNGYDAEPIDVEVIEKSINILYKLQGLPHVFPTARNSIQIEFENIESENYLEIEVSKHEVNLYMDTAGAEKERSIDNINIINKLISDLHVA